MSVKVLLPNYGLYFFATFPHFQAIHDFGEPVSNAVSSTLMDSFCMVLRSCLLNLESLGLR